MVYQWGQTLVRVVLLEQEKFVLEPKISCQSTIRSTFYEIRPCSCSGTKNRSTAISIACSEIQQMTKNSPERITIKGLSWVETFVPQHKKGDRAEKKLLTPSVHVHHSSLPRCIYTCSFGRLYGINSFKSAQAD